MNSTEQTKPVWPGTNDMLSLIIESISEVAWVFDPLERRLVHVTSSVHKLHDYSPEEFLEVSLHDWMTPASVEKMDQLISEQLPAFVYEGKQPNELVELELFRRDGTTFFAEISYKGYMHKPEGKAYVVGCTRDITRRKLAEENARKSFSMLLGATRLVNLGAWEYDVENGLYNVSAEWLKIYGFEESEFDGSFQQIMGQIHPEDRQRIQRITDDAFANKKGAPVDFRIIRKNDGSVRYLSLDSELQIDGEGNLKRIYGVVNDVTDKVQSELHRRESEESYQLFSDVTQEGIAIHQEGVALDVNNKFCQIFGYSREEIIGKKNIINKLFHPDELELIAYRIKNATGTRQRFRGIKADGSLLWLEVEGKHMLYKGKDARVVFIQNITEKVRALSSLADSEERNRVIVDNMPLACFAFDHEGTILLWNSEAQRIYGYTKEEALGSNGLDLVGTPEIIDNIKAVIGQVFEGKTQKSNEWNDKDKWGNTGWRVGNSFPIFNEEGKVIYGMNMVMDVSDLKQVNAELEEHKGNLEKLIEERTQQLKSANEDLKAVNESLHEANQSLTSQQTKLESALNDLKEAQTQLVQSEKLASLGTLTAGVAHEINNPLNFIHGGAMGLQLHFEGSEELESIKPFLGAINEGVQRVSGIVTSLNKFSSREANSGGKVQIHELIDTCITMIKGKHGCNLTFDRRYDTTISKIVGIESELHQAILNILTNAEEAIEDSGMITVYTKAVSKNAIRIAIQDSGRGIPAECISKIYDPFYTGKGREKNSGLGLYIAKSIIESHGGKINVKSQVKVGTLVEIMLPILNEEENNEEGKDNSVRRR